MPLSRYRVPKIARNAAFDHMNDCDLEIQSCGCDRSSCRCTRRRARLQARTAAYSIAIDIAGKIGRRESSRNGKSVEAIPLRSSVSGYAGIGLQPCSIHPRQISRKPASLSGEASLHLPDHRALPRLSSVTESIALPPRPKGGQDVKYQQIQYSRVAGASGVAAGLFCAADRRCDACSVVVHFGGPPPPAQAISSFARMKRTQSSLADKLNIRAVAALDRAREMPPGDARAEAMNKAMILRNAVEVHEHFCGKGGSPAS
jgi:hypothetical protein